MLVTLMPNLVRLHRDSHRHWPITMALLYMVCACTPSVFPYKALEGVNQEFDFSRWRMLPDQGPQQKIQLGGRILNAGMQGDTLQIVAAQLPIAKDPAHGLEEGKPDGAFVILYRAMVDPSFLRKGNRVMVVGQTSPPTQVEGDHTLQTLPTVTALCIHFWNDGEKEILVQGSPGAGSKALRELTYCNRAF